MKAVAKKRPPPPKKKKGGGSFGRTLKGRNKKAAVRSSLATPITRRRETRAYAGGIQSSAVGTVTPNLKDLPPEKLLRKCRDLIAWKDKNSDQVSKLEDNLKLANAKLEMSSNTIDKLINDHAENQSDTITGHNSQVKALSDLHADQLSKKQAEVRQLASQMREEKKTSNQVSTISFYVVYSCRMINLINSFLVMLYLLSDYHFKRQANF